MKQKPISPFLDWAEAERIANRTELALKHVLFTGHTPSDNLLRLVEMRRSNATTLLVLWHRFLEEANRAGART